MLPPPQDLLQPPPGDGVPGAARHRPPQGQQGEQVQAQGDRHTPKVRQEREGPGIFFATFKGESEVAKKNNILGNNCVSCRTTSPWCGLDGTFPSTPSAPRSASRQAGGSRILPRGLFHWTHCLEFASWFFVCGQKRL